MITITFLKSVYEAPFEELRKRVSEAVKECIVSDSNGKLYYGDALLEIDYIKEHGVLIKGKRSDGLEFNY